MHVCIYKKNYSYTITIINTINLICYSSSIYSYYYNTIHHYSPLPQNDDNHQYYSHQGD